MVEPPVSAAEVAEIHLRLANISSSLYDNDMMEDDEFQVRQITSNEEFLNLFKGLLARMVSLESGLETARAETGGLEKSRKTLEKRLTGLEEEEGGWEERLRGLVMRVNQFQQNILQVQTLPQQLHGLRNRVGRLEKLVPAKRV